MRHAPCAAAAAAAAVGSALLRCAALLLVATSGAAAMQRGTAARGGAGRGGQGQGAYQINRVLRAGACSLPTATARQGTGPRMMEWWVMAHGHGAWGGFLAAAGCVLDPTHTKEQRNP
jgi:hypothetical protein